MIKEFNHKALIIARESRELTQSELAVKTGIPQSTVSKIEHGLLGIGEDDLKNIAQVLDYPKSFFIRKMDIYPPNIHYRKKATVPVRILARVEAIMNIYKANVEQLLNSVELSQYHLPNFDDVKNLTAQESARYLRRFWNIPKGSIQNLTTLLEQKGIIVIEFDFGTEKIDGRSMITDKGIPIIFVNKNIPSDRKRFTIAHELGHIIMHVFSPLTFEVDVEDEAFTFAAEFLMPQNEIYSFVKGKLTIEKLADLKRYWKVSMQAIVYWAQKMKAITSNQARYLWSQFNSLRIKYHEPVEIQSEQPKFLFEIVDFFMTNLHYSEEALTDILCLNPRELNEMYLPQRNNIRLVR
jgi:Zn-dependent peptidase ImmA (M78 family)/DNA-binding XRE family transcriptional regulator